MASTGAQIVRRRRTGEVKQHHQSEDSMTDTKPNIAAAFGRLMEELCKQPAPSYPYEPNRLIEFEGDDGETRSCEQKFATVAIKKTEARQAIEEAKVAAWLARLRYQEACMFEDWAIAEAEKGHPQEDLIFDNYAHAIGYRKH
jgi:hypothetical protein